MVSTVPAQRCFLLLDPAWRPPDPHAVPPVEAVVGTWPAEDDGGLGRFRANPRYRPSSVDSPSDPLDAVLRLALRGLAEAGLVQLVVRNSTFDLAVNDDGRPFVTRSPDDVPCVVVVTGEPHRVHAEAPGWTRIDLDDLVVSLADGVDVLVNPGGPAAVRLGGDFVRDTLMLDERQVRDLCARYRESVSGEGVAVSGQVRT
ncbi:type VII secretion system-associated protein [Lentzea sp. CA-135723]|uniref:type VII secretion system-associated protein n=1 Tax=Lentzea sp. CA-135723 TaxID=3239950 RepID=UPI003D9220AA